MNIIETHQLSRRYGRNEALCALDLAVPTGSVFAFLGANGAGKTTTIKVLMNLLAPSSGEARVLGVDSRRLDPTERALIGYVSENQKLPLWMTVRQLLDYCRPFYPTWDSALERTLLAQFDLPAGRKLKHLSRGMLMKAALLSSLAYRPKLLVLDEPFSGLDPLTRDDFTSGILEASELGEWTVLVSSHDVEEVERFADHVGLLESGRLRFSETTEALLGRCRRIEVTLSGDDYRAISPPAGWLELERSGNMIRFVETRYGGEDTERACRERFPGGIMVARPMALREILVSLARASRRQPKGVAA